MANVTELSQWEAGIYQLENTDPVEGGSGGISNEQARLLGNRTKYLYDRLPRNVGGFSGLEVSVTLGGLSVFGNITIANATFATGGLSVVRCTMQNAMANTNYRVECFVESNSGFDPDSRVVCPIFKPVSTTQFDFAIRESSSAIQNLKVHISVFQL